MKTKKNHIKRFTRTFLRSRRIALGAILLVLPAAGEPEKEGWTNLFNGKNLEGWHANTGQGGDKESLKAEEIFTVRDGVISVYEGAKAGSKQSNANLYHESVWGNFHLQVEYRWLDNKFAPRNNDDRDAGILFHIHTNPKAVWPSSVEMQMGDGKIGSKYVTGDLFVLGSTRADSASPNGKYKEGEKMVTRGRGAGGVRAAVTQHAEKPVGEWNLAEVIVHGSDKAEFILNGELVNIVENMRYVGEDGEWLPLENGHISVQGEWATLEYRIIRVKEIEK